MFLITVHLDVGVEYISWELKRIEKCVDCRYWVVWNPSDGKRLEYIYCYKIDSSDTVFAIWRSNNVGRANFDI